jgi:uncharacterized phage protein gp47/JayE
MSSPTFPLTTLSVTISESGITAPSYEDILNSYLASLRQIYGFDIYLEPDSQDLQLAAVWTLAQHDSNQALISIYNGFLPSASQGAFLSALVKINGLARKISSNSIATLTLIGQAGTQIVNGVAQDANGNLWNLPPLVTIPAAGGIDAVATAQSTGNIAAGAGTINIISTPILGWQSVTNAADAEVGNAIETDAQLRARQAQSTSLPAQTTLQSIQAAVANLAGVRRSAIYENSSAVADGNGIPSHSIAVVVDGGDPTAIASVIELKKAPGTGTFGTTSIVVLDPSGLSLAINFFSLVSVPVYVTVTIRPLAGYVDLSGDIAQAIVDFINSIPIGNSVFYNWLFTPASLNGNLSFRILDIQIDINPAPVARADLFIAFNQAAASSINNVVVQVG